MSLIENDHRLIWPEDNVMVNGNNNWGLRKRYTDMENGQDKQAVFQRYGFPFGKARIVCLKWIQERAGWGKSHSEHDQKSELLGQCQGIFVSDTFCTTLNYCQTLFSLVNISYCPILHFVLHVFCFFWCKIAATSNDIFSQNACCCSKKFV